MYTLACLITQLRQNVLHTSHHVCVLLLVTINSEHDSKRHPLQAYPRHDREHCQSKYTSEVVVSPLQRAVHLEAFWPLQSLQLKDWLTALPVILVCVWKFTTWSCKCFSKATFMCGTGWHRDASIAAGHIWFFHRCRIKGPGTSKLEVRCIALSDSPAAIARAGGASEAGVQPLLFVRTSDR